jgi:hypothetical protein
MSAPVRPDYTFASDNTAGMAPEALAALTAANAGFAPSYGKDEWTEKAKRLVAGPQPHREPGGDVHGARHGAEPVGGG